MLHNRLSSAPEDIGVVLLWPEGALSLLHRDDHAGLVEVLVNGRVSEV